MESSSFLKAVDCAMPSTPDVGAAYRARVRAFLP